MEGAPSKLVRGTVDMLVLRALSTGTMHGYGVWSWIEEHGGPALRVEDAALYQSLRRLEGAGLVTSEWGLSENNRRARFYSLTASGSARLREEVSGWHRYREAVQGLLGVR
jgi:transcriptional regulator